MAASNSSILSNTTANTSLLSGTQLNISQSFPAITPENLLVVENRLKQLVSVFLNPPFDQPLFLRNSDDPKPKLLTFIKSYDGESINKIILQLQLNLSRTFTNFDEYISALEQLLSDAGQPEEQGGLSDDEVKQIYETLNENFEQMAEINVRIKVASFMMETVRKLRKLPETTGIENPLDMKIVELTANLTELFRNKLGEFRERIPRWELKRRKEWLAVLRARGMADDIPVPEEEDEGEEVTSEPDTTMQMPDATANEEDSFVRDDVSMKSDGQIEGNASQVTNI